MGACSSAASNGGDGERFPSFGPDGTTIPSDLQLSSLRQITGFDADVQDAVLARIAERARQHPGEARETDNHGRLPIHALCSERFHSNTDVHKILDAFRALVEAYPDSLEGREDTGNALLHMACSSLPVSLARWTYDFRPQVARMLGYLEMLPLHYCCRRFVVSGDMRWMDLIVDMLFDDPCQAWAGNAYAEAPAYVGDKDNYDGSNDRDVSFSLSRLYGFIERRYSLSVILLLFADHPESQQKLLGLGSNDNSIGGQESTPCDRYDNERTDDTDFRSVIRTLVRWIGEDSRLQEPTVMPMAQIPGMLLCLAKFGEICQVPSDIAQLILRRHHNQILQYDEPTGKFPVQFIDESALVGLRRYDIEYQHRTALYTSLRYAPWKAAASKSLVRKVSRLAVPAAVETETSAQDDVNVNTATGLDAGIAAVRAKWHCRRLPGWD